ncbi:MAG: 3-dehydroquinate synthase [Bacteroidales bacterium]|nr:3-dehydroquinate synthase [Bacteroidales bacterium]
MKSTSIQRLGDLLTEQKVSSLVILTDSNVDKLYSDYFSELNFGGRKPFKIVVSPGESSKSMQNVEFICRQLLENGYDKSVCMLNFGGGMITDLGGFAASIYKRGVRFVNVPTTLIAMVDAAIGGKTGVNLSHTKNVVGLISQPLAVMDPDMFLLQTLPHDELLSGIGEMIKYALIGLPDLFEELERLETLKSVDIQQSWVETCADFKRSVVAVDPNDEQYRHILNFGHTVGHAIEGALASMGEPISHGVAVAEGMLYEALLSRNCGILSDAEWQRIQQLIRRHFKPIDLAHKIDDIVSLMERDKKNRDGLINFTVLHSIGEAKEDFCVEVEECRLLLSCQI